MLSSTASVTNGPRERSDRTTDLSGREYFHLRATTSLRLPDAIHVATARRSGCSTFISNDQGLRAGAGLPVVVLSEVA